MFLFFLPFGISHHSDWHDDSSGQLHWRPVDPDLLAGLPKYTNKMQISMLGYIRILWTLLQKCCFVESLNFKMHSDGTITQHEKSGCQLYCGCAIIAVPPLVSTIHAVRTVLS